MIAAAKALAAAATSCGGIVIAVVIVICLCGIILASPLGIFFAGSDETTRAVSSAQTVAQINGELGEKISSMQADGGYDMLEIQGQPPPGLISWRCLPPERQAQRTEQRWRYWMRQM